MKGKIDYNDEIKPPSKTAEDAGHFNTVAREKNATGTNSTARHKVKHKPFGKLGGKNSD